jgi:predicted MFS family arabinose efflux permease
LLVYVGALFTESYGTSTTETGVLLSLAAVAFTVGNLTFRRYAGGDPRHLLVMLALALAAVVPLIGTLRSNGPLSAALLAVAAFLGGARTLLGNAYGLRAAPERRVSVMAARAAANQFGYFIGSAAGGAALAAWGYPGLGVALAVLFVGAAASVAGLSVRSGPRAAVPRVAS